MKKKYVIIIAILAVIIVGLIVALVVTNLPKKEKAVDEPKEEVQKFEPLYLALDSDIVADMYERVKITPRDIFHKFDGNELNLENISDDALQTAAFYYGKLDKYSEKINSTASIYSSKLDKKYVDEMVKKMFGVENFKHGNIYYIDEGIIRYAYDENDDIYYSLGGFGGAHAPFNYSAITEVIEYEDRYEAKEMFIFGHMVGPEYEVRDYDGNVLNENNKYKIEDFDNMESNIVGYSDNAICKKVLTAYEKQAYGYKHTFMKNSDGTYTWAKTEKLN